jgi:hypothetical protein
LAGCKATSSGANPGPTEGDVCQGAQGPLEHSHFFTEDGAFGSLDEHGEEVDGGDYEVVDEDTLAFPSHASEFGYDGDLVVDYQIDGDIVTFDVVLPEACEETCKDAYAWALSAFASGPWTRSGADEAATEGECPTAAEGSVPASMVASSGPAPLGMGDLPPGQYTTNSFEPNLVLTLPDGWHQFFPDDADEIALGGPGAELNITRPAEVIDPESAAPVEAPDSLLGWFTDHSRLDGSEPVEVQVDCIDSHYVDLTAPTADVALFHYPGGDMRLPAGVSTRLYIVPLEGPDLVALILPPPGANDLDAVLRQAEPIVLALAINE